MGKDLNGNELGVGYIQEKNGLYSYRKRTLKKTVTIRSKTMPSLMDKVKELDRKRQQRARLEGILPQPCVYFITDGEYVKIGATDNLVSRIRSLQTGNPRELEILDVIYTNNTFELEKCLHKVFKNKRVNKEWFDIKSIFENKKSV